MTKNNYKKFTIPLLAVSILFTGGVMMDSVPNVYAQTVEERLDALEASDIAINTSVSDMYDYMVELFTVLFAGVPVIQSDVEGLKNGTIVVPVDWSTISSVPTDIADGDDLGTIIVTDTTSRQTGVVPHNGQASADCPDGYYVSGLHVRQYHDNDDRDTNNFTLTCKEIEVQ